MTDPESSEQKVGHGEPEDLLSAAGAGATALRGGILRVGAYFIGILVSTISAAMLFRHLGVVVTGQYVSALSLVAIVSSISDLGLTAVGVREISTRPVAERSQLASDLLGLRLALALIGGLLVTGIAWIAYSATLAVGVAFAIVGLVLAATQDNFSIALIVDLRLGWLSILELMRSLLTAAATVALVLLGAHLLPFLGMSIPIGVIMVIAAGVLVRQGRNLVPNFSLHRWRTFAKTMLPYSAAVAASALYFRLSILMVSALSTSVQLGYFSASYRIIEVLTTIPTLLMGTVFPILARAARDDHGRLGYALGKAFDLSLIAGAWIAVSLATAAPVAIEIIGGPNFRPATQVLAYQGIALGASFINMVWGYGLLSLGLYRLILGINTSALALNIAIVAPLAAIGGARDAAIGTAVTEIAVAVLQGFALAHRRPLMRISLRIVPRVLAAAAVSLLPLAVGGIPPLVRLCISTVIFVVLLLLTRSIPPELWELVPLRWEAGRLRRRVPPS